MLELPAHVAGLVARGDGIVGRRQLLEAGASDADLRRWCRWRLVTRVHPGVYADTTGSLSWHQRARAAVLYAEPAALHGVSALRWHGAVRLGDDAPIEIAVAARRDVRAQPGVLVCRARGLEDRVSWHVDPPRVRVEEAAIDAAAAASGEMAAVGLLAEVVGSRRTSPQRMAQALAGRSRVAHRPFLEGVLDDLTHGACSVLERGFLHRVERAHGLPTVQRQVRASARGTIFRDVLYPAYGVVVELDGRLHHTRLADRDRDLDRDLEAAVDGLLTIRLGWGQVYERACLTVRSIARVLRRRGWAGSPRPCRSCSA